MGNVTTVNSTAAGIKAQGDTCVPFSNQMVQLAGEFDLEGIQKLMGSLLICSSVLAEEITSNKKPWHILGFFDGENAELEKICEYNINQLEAVDSTFAKIVVVYDRTYKQSRDSSVRKKELFKKYSKSKFAKETGWDELMMTYHDYILHKSRDDS
jgi:hypothetical protein